MNGNWNLQSYSRARILHGHHWERWEKIPGSQKSNDSVQDNTQNKEQYLRHMKNVNPQNLFVLNSARCSITLPVCPSITDILQISKAAATPSVTMGTWVLWDAAFSTVWISIGSKSIPCSKVSPEETERAQLQNRTLLYTSLHNQWSLCCHKTRKRTRHTIERLWISQSICQSLLSLNFNCKKLDDTHFRPSLTDRTRGHKRKQYFSYSKGTGLNHRKSGFKDHAFLREGN